MAGDRPKRRRADVALEAIGLAESRTKAQRLIMAGEVWIGDARVPKPSTLLSADDVAALEVRRRGQGYVGRGAQKLAPVLEALDWDVREKVCLDVGASTGGFTEILLRAGAAHVWSVDVGYGQLHPRLRKDERVTVRERTNFRHWNPDAEDAPRFDFAVMDVSFISATLLLSSLFAALRPHSRALVLVKPQFELGRDRVPRGGVVRDEASISEAVQRVTDAAAAEGFTVSKTVAAGVPGRSGNQEVFLALTKSEDHGAD